MIARVAMVDGLSHQALAIVSAFSSVGGVAYHLWMGRPISVRQWVGAMVLSGFCGALTYLWLFEDVDSQLKLIAISILSGILGTSLLDLATTHVLNKLRKAIDVD
jgi:hypothetical protein